jgi:predicted DNA-binding transcriptional regulator AlpA
MSNSQLNQARLTSSRASATDIPEATRPRSSDLLTAQEVCQMLGGPGSPIHAATLYRGVAVGRFPRPLRISPNVARWIRSEIEAVIARAAADRVA